MKLQRSTVILVGMALLLGAGVLIAESQRSRSPQTAEVGPQAGALLGFAESEVTTLRVERQGETLLLERQGDGNWQMIQPQRSPAEPGAVAFLLSRLNTDAPLQTVTMAPDQVADFGFSDPAGTVTVTLQNGTDHVLILGGPEFSGSANYAIIDPPTWPPEPEGAPYEVLVVNRDIANGINRPLEEWKMPVESPSQEEASPSTTPSPGAETEAPVPAGESPPETEPGSGKPPEETN
ncbi:MAG TPA: DUF4340 domain-containing protein [Leptolyngbyaceae cyanobacterium M65_K2018_010]|nr:DUF4340 domain-containing protein [Leptolyngbyaceae cyanobacterium M65_K2018_010]